MARAPLDEARPGDTARGLLQEVYPWYTAGETFALATVVGTFRSAPRRPGAAMAVSAAGDVVGSVSGGCVEGAVYEAAVEARDTGRAALHTYGVSDDDAFAVGLTCGGILDVFVEPVSRAAYPQLAGVMAALAAREPVAVATVVAGPEDGPGALGRRLAVWSDRLEGTLGSGALDAIVAEDVRGLLGTGTTGLRHYAAAGLREGGDLAVFTQSFLPPPRMLVFGAIDFAAAVARIGTFLGYRVTVCDARPLFATPARFPEAEEVVVRWPHDYLAAEAAAGRVDERTVVAVLTHDPKFDVPLLQTALRMPKLAYVGALGSRRTHDDRLARLREAGLGAGELARLRSPVGLDLGGHTPEETAVSIAAEIIASAHGGSGLPLHGTDGPVHAAVIRG
ncbi:MAG TPA: XdhC/CoxI family protein [Actinocrinis sp.]|jgi:xanthine dehydrogenase accessory factor